MNRRLNEWLDRAASIDEIIAYALVAILAVALLTLVVEMVR